MKILDVIRQSADLLDGYCYIDKTEKIYKLVKTGSYYFLN